MAASQSRRAQAWAVAYADEGPVCDSKLSGTL